MQRYPGERCRENRAEDLTAYERYRETTERYLEERRAQQRRDQELLDVFDRDPGRAGQ